MDHRPTDHRALFEKASALASAYRDALPDRPVGARATLPELRRALALPLPDEGVPGDQVLDELSRGVEGGLMGMASPRYFGFVIGASSPVGVAADFLTSAWGQNSGLHAVAPAQSVVEEVAAGWLLDVLGLPANASVGLVTGCQMANFTALAAARHEVLRRAGWNVEEDGLQGAPLLRVVVGDEVHVTILRALRFLGLGNRAVARVPVDGQGRMRADALATALSSLPAGPTIVCAQAGNVNTGAIDPLPEIAQACKARGAWLHVDGAFGLWAAASPSLRHLVRGAELADSWATDAHKWLNVPYDSGLVICSHPGAHRAAMTTSAPYLIQSAPTALGVEDAARAPSGRDTVDWVPEFSRRARGFAVYAGLRALGRNGVSDLVERSCQHASRIADSLGRSPHASILNEVALNQVLVRFTPPRGDADAFTRAVILRVQREGVCYLAGTVWKGKAAMRISVSGEATTSDDADRTAEAIAGAAGREIGPFASP